MKIINRNAITLYGTQEFLTWIKATEPHLHQWTMNSLNHRPSVYMLEVEDQNCHGAVVLKNFQRIVENELAYLYISRDKWPEVITQQLFESWFYFKYHEDIYDLCETELKAYDD